MSTTTRDVIIVGSGPAGWTAAIYAARANLAPLVIAGMTTPGGALMTTTGVENFPGFPDGIQGPELMGNMQDQAERFGAEVIYDDAVDLDLAGDIKTVTTAEGETYTARAVILALGSEHRKLGVPGEQTMVGKGVSYCATCDGFFFAGQHVAVVGGGDSAMEEALFMRRYAPKVYVIHRRGELRASKVLVDRVKADPNIELVLYSEVAGINHTDKVFSVTVSDTIDGSLTMLEDVTGVFIAIGHDPRTAMVAGQVELDDNGYIFVAHPTTATNLPGVFACGDVVDSRYRQAITAAGTGCASALDAERYLAEADLRLLKV